jgi:hypothetical protein
MKEGKEVRFWHKGEFYLVMLFLMTVIMFVTLGTGFPRLARIFPLLVGSAGLLLIALDILQLLVPKFSRRFQSFRGGEVFESRQTEAMYQERGQPTDTPQIARPMSILKTVLWFAGAFAGFYLLGYLPFSVLFLFLFLKFYSSLSLKMSAAITAGVSLFLWVTFSFALKLDIFQGSALLYGLF